MRLQSLDGVRGLAAFVVVLNHCYLILPESVSRLWIVPYVKWTPLRVIMVGRPAVVMFFVLSGLVLGLSLLKGRGLSFRDFALRRVLRIYPPYAVAILFSALMLLAAAPQPIASFTPWFNHNWSDGAGLDVLAGHLLMLNRPADATLDTVVWSLAYEMRISLLMPVMLVLALWLGFWRSIAATGVFAVSVEVALRLCGIESGAYHNASILDAVLTTAHYVPLFVAGLLIAMNLDRFKRAFTGLRTWAWWCLALFVGATMTQYPDVISGVGAIITIGLVLGSPRLQSLLESRPVAWLGRVSYSLYLFHLPILLLLAHRLHDVVPPPVYLGVGVVVSLVVAELAYRLIEEPSIKLARSLTSGRFPEPARAVHRLS